VTTHTPRISIPHNLPSLQPFFGREEELRRIADALDPESRTWGALIDGPGGMGKTSLAVRAAYDAADAFDKIAFVSLKSRELDDDGVRDLSGFLISGLAELLNELARELDHAEIAKTPQDQRPRLLLDVLRGTRTLLVLDNLESLIKFQRDIVFNFVKRLPVGCKAILTSRERIGSAAEELILEKLSDVAALATLAKLAETNPALAKTSEAERLDLYRETGGKPLLLRWTAGQIGRGSCLTLSDAIAYLRSRPDENDPLEFIFGDLVENFSRSETPVLCALTYFTLPAKAEHIAELAECTETDTDRALRSLVNRSLVVLSDELKAFSLVPLVADFLHKKKPPTLAETGDRLEKLAYALVMENGYGQHNLFPRLDDAWPTVAAALPGLIAGDNLRLQRTCAALDLFLDYTGRWDELIALARDAENRAVALEDFQNAGWRAIATAWVHFLRNEPEKLFASVDRAEKLWCLTAGGSTEQAEIIWFRGLGHKSLKDYGVAIAAFHEAVTLWRSLDPKSLDVARGLNSLANAKRAVGDLDAAEHYYREALQIARTMNHLPTIADSTGNLAELALDRENWAGAEALAREALSFSEKIGRQEIIGSHCHQLAEALVRQEKKAEALPYAQRSVNILTRLGMNEELGAARVTLSESQR
jgi:tetratricopeptide (TPR) repeat protein